MTLPNVHLEFGKGTLAELICYDRYSITSQDLNQAKIGDIVIFVDDVEKKTQKVGTIEWKNNDIGVMEVVAHDNSGTYTVCYEEARLVLETKPYQLWERWAKGAASVETDAKREQVENDFKKLLNNYRYIPGGRIQSMLGVELAGFNIPKSKLTSYNCLVLPSPSFDDANTHLENWLNILEIAWREANSMSFGSGVGINISTIEGKIHSPRHKNKVQFKLNQTHAEYEPFKNISFNHSEKEVSPLAYQLVVEDSREGIFKALNQMVTLSYTEKDIVLDFSLLRPKGAYVKGVNGVSSGAISWIKLFDFVLGLLRKEYIDALDVAELYAFIPQLISQGGSRRGALILVLDIDHESVPDFIKAKTESGKLIGANLSLNVSDEFMNRVKQGDIKANELFQDICYYAWATGEPGLVFGDIINEVYNLNYDHLINCTNPCGEIPLSPNGVCNLGHHFLPQFLIYRNGEWEMNWEELAWACETAVRFQDNVIDYSPFFDDDIKKVQLSQRKLGIGTIGLATVLIKLGIRYGSDEALEFTEDLMHFIALHTYESSIELGFEKGNFPLYDPEKIDKNSFLCNLMGYAPATLRNSTLLTQAPTGSTGTMLDNIPGFNASTGIEPYFSFEYYRAGRLGVTKQEVDLVKEWRMENPNQELPSYFVTAQDLTPEEHIKMQGAIQKYVDSSISKTTNMPSSATVDEVKGAYLLAYDLKCKGTTVYRDGSRSGQVLSTSEEKAKLEEVKLSTDKEKEPVIQKKPFKKRPRVLKGMTVKQATPMGNMYVTFNQNENQIEEVFISIGKVGSDVRAITDSLGILMTLALSERLSNLTQQEKLNWLGEKLTGIKGANPIGFGPSRIESLPDALGKVITNYILNETESEEVTPPSQTTDLCPTCGNATLVKSEGCEHCSICGFSKCSG